MEDLLELIRLLCAEHPWHRAQTHQTLKSSFIEETYEALDAIDRNDADGLCEELGDVLLQVVLHAQLEAQKGGFTFDDVCDGLCRKLIYRHPGFFDDQPRAESAADIRQQWDRLKDAEKGIHTAAQDVRAVPESFPALLRAQKVCRRALRHGFGEADQAAVWRSVLSKAEAVADRGGADAGEMLQREYGEALFALAAAGQLCGLNAEVALADAVNAYIGQIEQAEQRTVVQNGTATPAV